MRCFVITGEDVQLWVESDHSIIGSLNLLVMNGNYAMKIVPEPLGMPHFSPYDYNGAIEWMRNYIYEQRSVGPFTRTKELINQ